MKINLATDAMSLPEAADYLKLSEKAIALAVIENNLKCGVIAKRWTGIAHPHPYVDYPNLPAVRCADECRLWEIGMHDIDHRREIIKWSQTEEKTGFNIITTQRYASMFWYIYQYHAQDILMHYTNKLSDKVVDKSIEITHLEPLDGAHLHQSDPDGFPWPRFIFSILLMKNKDRSSLRITKDDLLFLRPDLDALRVKLGLPQKDSPIGRRTQQFQIILGCIEKLGYPAQAIPTGGRAEILRLCLEHTALFTKEGFKHAWKAGTGDGLWKMKEHDKFAASE